MSKPFLSNTRWAWLSASLIGLIILAVTPPVFGVAVFVQVVTGSANSTTVSASYTNTPAANHLLVVVCSVRTTTTGATTLSVPSPAGFTLAKNSSGNTVFQSIFYKIAGGTEGTVRCQSSRSGRMAIQMYEYSGNTTTAPAVLEAVSAGTTTGTSTTVSSGTVTTTSTNNIIVAAMTKNSGGAAATWANSFVERVDFLATGRYFGADRFTTAPGNYVTSVTSTTAVNWVGQAAAFKLLPIQLTGDIVDAAGATVATPAVTMAAQTFGFTCQSSIGTLGTATQKIRVSNTTSAPAWELSIAPTAGTTAKWSDGTNAYDVNDPSGTGCTDGTDADTIAGQLTVDPSVASLTPGTGCTNTGLTQGASTALSEGVTNSIVLLAGGPTATINCYWDLTGVQLSQTIPPEQKDSSAYTLSLTLTIIAK